MYIIEDRVTPRLTGYLHALGVKNTFLRNFPTKEVDGITVFDKLVVYNGVVNLSTQARKIYHLLNIRVSDLTSADWSGLEEFYIHLKRYDTSYSLSLQDLKDFINENSTIDEEYTTRLVYDPVDIDAIAYTSDTDLINLVLGNKKDIHFSPDSHPLTALALLDTSSVMFDTTIIVTDKTLVKRKINNRQFNNLSQSYNILKAELSLKFKRIINVDDITVSDYLNYILNQISIIDSISPTLNSTNNLNVNNTGVAQKNVDTSRTSSINKQLINIVEAKIPLVESNIIYPVVNPSTGNITYYIKYDGVAALNTKDFLTFLGKTIDTGYIEESASFWKEALMMIVTIVIIVIAVVLAIPSGGISTVGAFAAFAAEAAFYVAIAMALEALILKALANRGQYAYAAMVGDSLQVLGMVSTFLGVLGVVGSWASAIGRALKEITMKTVAEGLKTQVALYAKQATSNILGFVVDMLTTAFQIYSKVINPPTEGLDESAQALAATEKELEDYATPDMRDKVQYIFENPYANIYDMNEYMQNIPYFMTQGRIDSATTKYYS